MTPLPLRLDQGCHHKVVFLLVTARDLPGRISTIWVTSQLAGLVSKSPASIPLSGDSDDRHPLFLGTGQQTCPPRCICSGPALCLQHQLTVCSGTLSSVQDKPSLLSQAALPCLSLCMRLPGRSKSFAGLLKEPRTLTRGALFPDTCSCAISILQGWSFGLARRGKIYLPSYFQYPPGELKRTNMLPTIKTWPGYSGILRKLSQGRIHLT